MVPVGPKPWRKLRDDALNASSSTNQRRLNDVSTSVKVVLTLHGKLISRARNATCTESLEWSQSFPVLYLQWFMGLRTLGGLSLPEGRFGRPKPLLVVAYLALRGPQDRRHLEELFWPHASNPRHSLSMAISQLHKAAPELICSSETLLWTEVECDAAVLLEAATNHEWQRVTDLHEGPFLAGVDIATGNIELEEWLYETRELLELHAQSALVEVAERYLATGDLYTAAQLAEKAATIARSNARADEPQRLARLYSLLAETGNPRAEAIHEKALSLGVSLPAAEVGAPRRQAAIHNLPGVATQFVGRHQELQDLEKLLAEGARLLTITGFAGNGKSRLALELAQRLQRDANYELIYFVPLEAIKYA